MSTNCVFCKIISKESPAEIYYEDEEIIIFKDIKPASKMHFLAVPKRHIKDINSLSSTDLALVEKMVQCSKNLVQEKGGSLEDILQGFHKPPFNSVSHLHLHTISPQSEMYFIGNIVYCPSFWWFTTGDDVLGNLRSNL